METEKAGKGGQEENSGKPKVCQTIQRSGLCDGKKKSGTGPTVGGKTHSERKRENPNEITKDSLREHGNQERNKTRQEGDWRRWGNPSNREPSTQESGSTSRLFKWIEKKESLVLAQNEHYWRVSDIANQKASEGGNLVYGSRITADIAKHWGEPFRGEYRNRKRTIVVREEARKQE